MASNTYEILKDVFDAQSGTLNITPDNTYEVLNVVHDETNEALRVNIVGGSGGTSLWENYDTPATPATYATFEGIPAGCSTSVLITADNIGVVGNSIEIGGNGVDDITTRIGVWNTDNPSNTATLTSGDGSQVINNKVKVYLSGGAAATAGGSSTGIQVIDSTSLAIGEWSIASGYINISAGDYSSIIGGYDNEITDDDYASILGGRENIIRNTAIISPSITSTYSSILGGSNNIIDESTLASIIGGEDNVIESSYYSLIAGGSGNEISSLSDATRSNFSSIIGGNRNIITEARSAIIGGTLNTVRSEDSAIIGGNYNEITVNSTHCFIGGGNTNKLDTYHAINSAIIGGSRNTVGMNNSVIIGGDLQTLNTANTVMVPKLVTSEHGEGVIMYSPDGTAFNLTVDNSGNLVTTAV